MQTFAERKARLVEQLKAASTPIGLGKDTSNLFRDREAGGKRHLNVRDFNHVLEVNVEQGWVDVEGMAPYDALTEHSSPSPSAGLSPVSVSKRLRSSTVWCMTPCSKSRC